MSLKRKTGILLASGLIIASGITATYAFGGRGGGHGYGMGRHMGYWMTKADADEDGAITLEEVEAMRGKRFAEFDKNADGVVDEAELKARIEEKIKKRIERRVKRMTRRFDKNRDGRITKEEFNSRARERFSWNDLNDDGKLDGDELPRRKYRGSHHRR